MNARDVIVQIDGKEAKMHTGYLIRRRVAVNVAGVIVPGRIAGGNAQTGAVVYGADIYKFPKGHRCVVRFTWSALLRAVEHQEILRV